MDGKRGDKERVHDQLEKRQMNNVTEERAGVEYETQIGNLAMYV